MHDERHAVALWATLALPPSAHKMGLGQLVATKQPMEGVPDVYHKRYQERLCAYAQLEQSVPGATELNRSLNTFPHVFQLDFFAAFRTLLATVGVKETDQTSRLLPDEVQVVFALGQVTERQAAMGALSHLALHPLLTAPVMLAFKPIWMHIVALWLDAQDSLAVLSAFAATMETNPATLRQVFSGTLWVLWLISSQSLFKTFIAGMEDVFDLLPETDQVAQWPTTELRPTCTDGHLPLYFSHPRLAELLLALYRIGVFLPLAQCFKRQDKLLRCLQDHPCLQIRLLSLKVLKHWRPMSLKQYDQLSSQYVYAPNDPLQLVPPLRTADQSDLIQTDLVLSSSGSFDGQSLKIQCKKSWRDVWLLERDETARLHALKRDFVSVQPPITLAQPFDVSPFLADFDGLLLPKQAMNAVTPDQAFVPTRSAIHVLRQLAISAVSRLPTILLSAPSAGKNTVFGQLSLRFGLPLAHLVTIDLSDRSIDAKSLIGTLSSSSRRPGTFTFVEGVVTKCLRLGRWLLVSNIDRAADDVLVLLASIVEPMIRGEKATVTADGRTIEASPGFMLFATQAVNQTPKAFIGQHFWHSIELESPSEQEMSAIVQLQHPRLARGIDKELIGAWAQLKSQQSASSRPITLRHLLRWCARVEAALPSNLSFSSLQSNPLLQEDAFLEAFDLFFACQGDHTSEVFQKQLKDLGDALGLSTDRVTWLLSTRSIAQTASPTQIKIGRSSLSIGATVPEDADASPFALNRPTLLLLERLAVAVSHNEPVLLVGETGTGKTTSVSHLAQRLGKQLIALNLSNQTEITDLVGGFKPIDQATVTLKTAATLTDRFIDLFDRTFGLTKNAEYITTVRASLSKKRWPRLLALFRDSFKKAETRIQPSSTGSQKVKRRKTDLASLAQDWSNFIAAATDFELRFVKAKSAPQMLFQFVDGPLIQALQSGDWILLDEINLATSETLDVLTSLLRSSTSTFVLSERGSLEQVQRHPDFRIFGCMNPATDVGKRDLLPDLRSRFSEFYVPSPDDDVDALRSIIGQYLTSVAVGDRAAIADTADVYSTLKNLACEGKLADGTNQPPHFSMRTLARALRFAVRNAPAFGLRRAIYEGFLMTFTTSLDASSETVVIELLQRTFFKTTERANTVLSRPPPRPQLPESISVSFHHFSLPLGPLPAVEPADYILTPSVTSKLVTLARVISAQSYPILIQGPTSSGKTSMIEYLARRTGHHFIRINNHQHTDIQEYLGTYISDPSTGVLTFKEGLLVQALRRGSWIVLDELNLAPSDVLEALNRLLDDNRELFVSELNETIKPAKGFMLFATQNPPTYSGRKALSRAFRNRFAELFFDDVPKSELATILQQRCRIAPSYAAKMVEVYDKLQHRRQIEKVFEERHSYATLRDLFRWGSRPAIGYEQLATQGFMLIGERSRNQSDKAAVIEVLESVMKVHIDLDRLYNDQSAPLGELVWTSAARRMFVLAREALRNKEPVLLVGETGAGKTAVCQVLARDAGLPFLEVNCHLNTDSSDLIGGYRPNRQRSALQAALLGKARALVKELGILVAADGEDLISKLQALPRQSLSPDLAERVQDILTEAIKANSLFEWADGPLIEAMRQGGLLLLDEISLADDSVLERLNSVLEPGRTLTLAEKGSGTLEELQVTAADNFAVIATMNPGGDFGKKELSPALRNRFTEVWIPAISDREEDLLSIIEARLARCDAARILAPQLAKNMLAFANWFHRAYRQSVFVSLRDLLAWADFICISGPAISLNDACIHGAFVAYIDAVSGTGTAISVGHFLSQKTSVNFVQSASPVDKLKELFDPSFAVDKLSPRLEEDSTSFACGPFRFTKTLQATSTSFNLHSPTSSVNTMRLCRALQINKPILLEGSPGVGKTSLVQALATVLGVRLVRVNLSDQSDLTDLFGADTPAVGLPTGHFEFQAAPFLRAMQEGAWVLLDEMNLAPQQVLEGLNSCLDYRRTVYISELGKTFEQAPGFRVFAAQNPLQEGGARKGLPRSFLDRFTQVWISKMGADDLVQIAQSQHPATEQSFIDNVVQLVSSLSQRAGKDFGTLGAPWDFNIRDVLRWLGIASQASDITRFCDVLESQHHLVDVLFLQRFRTLEDREAVLSLYNAIFPTPLCIDTNPNLAVTETGFLLGSSSFQGYPSAALQETPTTQSCRPLRALATALSLQSLAILVGPRHSGKSSLIRHLAKLSGRPVNTFYASTQTDALDLLGSFEQRKIAKKVLEHLRALAAHAEAQQISQALVQDLPGLTASFSDALSEDADASALRQPLLLLLERIPVQLRALPCFLELQSLSSDTFGNEPSSFEWNDGPVVRSMKEGHWFVIENANLCPSSVLDRLNSLFDTKEGTLMLNERGLKSTGGDFEIVHPHPDFRLIMTVDPTYGELSRAMRNRAIEICLPTADTFQLRPTLDYPLFDSNPAEIVTRQSRMAPADLGIASRQAWPALETMLTFYGASKPLAVLQSNAGKAGNLMKRVSDIPLQVLSDCSSQPSDLALDILSRPPDAKAAEWIARVESLTRIMALRSFCTDEGKTDQTVMKTRGLIQSLGDSITQRISSHGLYSTKAYKADHQLIWLLQDLQQLVQAEHIDFGSLLMLLENARDTLQPLLPAEWALVDSYLTETRASVAPQTMVPIWRAFLEQPPHPLFHALRCTLEDGCTSVATLRLALEVAHAIVKRGTSDTVNVLGTSIIERIHKATKPGRPTEADDTLLRIHRHAALLAVLSAFIDAGHINEKTTSDIVALASNGGCAYAAVPVGAILNSSDIGFLGAREVLLQAAPDWWRPMLQDSIYSEDVRSMCLAVVSIQSYRDSLTAKKAAAVALLQLARLQPQPATAGLSALVQCILDKLNGIAAEFSEAHMPVLSCPEVNDNLGPRLALGIKSIAAARQLWRSFAPDKSFDPAVAAHAVDRALVRRCESLLDFWICLGAYGYRSKLRSTLVSEEIKDLEQIRQARPVESVPRRQFQGQILASFVRQIQSFYTTYLADQTIDTLVSHSRSPKDHSKTLATLENLSLSIRSFQHRLVQSYTELLPDICRPLLASSLLFRIGLESLASHVGRDMDQSARGSVSSASLTSYVRIVSEEPLACPKIISVASFSSIQAIRTLTDQETSGFKSLTHAIFADWKAQDTKRRMKEAEEAAEYKSKEDPTEDQEMQELFGTILDREDPIDNSSMSCQTLLVETFMDVFLSRRHPAPLQQLMSSVDEHFLTNQSSSPDLGDLVHRVALLSKQKDDPSMAGKRNFYHDPVDPAAFEELIPLLEALKSRATEIQAIWPDQTMLTLLLDRVQTVLQANATTTTARLLADLEQLLDPLDDWQAIASSDVSLSEQKQEVISYIIELRKAELKSWPDLLSAELDSFSRKAKSYWWHLYDLFLVNSGHDAPPHSNDAGHPYPYLADIVKFLDDCPAGQFAVRLDLLQAFAAFAATQGRTEASNLLNSFVTAYGRHSQSVAGHIRKQLDEHGSRLKEVVQLAKWKDVNVEALKISAAKSHRALLKVVRSFRKSLQMAASNYFSPVRHLESFKAVRLPAVSILPASTPVPSSKLHLQNITQTFKRFRSVYASFSATLYGDPLYEGVFDLSTQIAATAKALRQEVVAPDDKGARSNLLNRKRRALADLLRELKRIGLSRNPSSAVMLPQRNLLRMHSLGPAHSDHLDSPFYALLDTFAQVRNCQANIHPDLQPTQVAFLVGHLESTFAIVRMLRIRLFQLQADFTSLERLTTWLDDAKFGDQPILIKHRTGALQTLTVFVHQLEELTQSAQLHSQMVDDSLPVSALVGHVQAARNLMPTLESFLGESNLPVTRQEIKAFQDVENLVHSAAADISDLLQTYPSWAYLLKPALELIQKDADIHLVDSFTIPDAPPTDLNVLHEQLIDRLLLSFQDLQPLFESLPKRTSDSDMPDASISIANRTLQLFANALRHSHVTDATLEFCQALPFAALDVRLLSISRVLPFLQTHKNSLHDLMSYISGMHQSMVDLCSTVAVLTVELAEKGFCQPQEMESPDGAEGDAELADGTGLGSGSAGNKNVSDQIENQEQVEGLQDEKPDEDEPGDDGDPGNAIDGDGLEMDGAKDEEVEMQETASNDEDQDENEEEQDVDEQMDNVDPLAESAVDEKFWANEEKDQPAADDVAPEAQGQQQQSNEIVADETAQQQPQPDSSDDPRADEQEENADEAPLPPDQQQIDMQNSDPLDQNSEELPEKEQEEEELEDMAAENNGEDGDLDSNQDSKPPEAEDITEQDGESPQDQAAELIYAGADDKELDNAMEIDDAAAEDDAEPEQDPSNTVPESGGDLDENGDSQATATGDTQTTQTEAQSDPAKAQEENGEPDSSDPRSGDADKAGDDQAASKSSSEPAVPKAQSGSGTSPENSEQPQRTTDRQLGEALEKWSRQLKAIDEELEGDQEAEPQPMAEPTAEEPSEQREAIFAAPEESYDNQALAAANTSEAAQTRDLQPGPSNEPVDGAQDEDVEMGSAEERDEVTTIALDQPAVLPSGVPQPTQALPPTADSTANDPMDLLDETPVMPAEGNLQLDAVASKIQFSFDLSQVSAAEAWQQYCSSVRPLSFSLTEQLRLILEPTQASRLEGDYRSGKRLNMKRIIPFIASEYTKDKIWLRRTKPFDRRYQIMVALDDSQSMSEPMTVNLAFQALALVSTALARLEVGQVAVTSFGETVRAVHSFDDGPVSDEAGQRILEKFSFQQGKTDYAALLRSSLQEFQDARQKSTAGGPNSQELWQLQIIISDGLMPNQEQIPALLRKAKESKVLVVFLVLDAATSRKASTGQSASETSILQMTRVMTAKDPQTGHLSIQTQRYMDLFPFEYYVVLRSAEDLPDMLCRLLRQFFGMASQQ